MKKTISEVEKNSFNEMKRVLPYFGLNVCGTSVFEPCITTSDNKPFIFKMDDMGFHSDNELVRVRCSAYTHLCIEYIDKRNLTKIVYSKNPIPELNLIDSEERVRISKHFDENNYFMIDIKTNSSLNNVSTSISIDLFTMDSYGFNDVRTNWRYIEIFHKDNYSEIYVNSCTEPDSRHTDTKKLIGRIRELILDIIGLINSHTILSEENFTGVEEALDKSLALILPGMNDLIIKRKKRFDNL